MTTKLTLPLLLLLAIPATVFSQNNLFKTAEYIDINNIKAITTVHGDMHLDPVNTVAACEYPKGSGKNIVLASGVWMSGVDMQGQVTTSAQTYRTSGTDFWPGQIAMNGSITYAASEKWAKVWKINRSEILQFLAESNHTTSNTPASILEWPAKGNVNAKGNNGVSLTITEDAAPFVDIDNDGVYEPLDGEYPDMKGDQMLWWIFNDKGPTYNISGGTRLGVEVHASAYAYHRYSLIDNVIYYEFEVNNKNSNDYLGYRFGFFSDGDIGDFNDDYIGKDSVRRLGFMYNGKSTDNIYGTEIPMMGVTLVNTPGDVPGQYIPVGAVQYYYNDMSIIGNPISDGDFFNYLNGQLRNIQPFDASVITLPNSMCAANIPLGDHRFFVTTPSYPLPSGTSLTFTYALVATPPATNNSCPNPDFTGIQEVTDTAWKVFYNPLPVGVANTQKLAKNINIYPNPAGDYIYADVKEFDAIRLHDALGRNVSVNVEQQSGKAKIDVSALPAGLYLLQINDKNEVYGTEFIKE